MTGPGKCRNVVFPRCLVEINGQEPTGFITKQRVNPDNVPTLQMVKERFAGNVYKRLVWALTTFDARFVADSSNPLIITSGRVTFLSGFLVNPHQWIDVIPTTKQVPKELDLFLRRLVWMAGVTCCCGNRSCLRLLKILKRVS